MNSKLEIFVIDDERILRKSLADELREEGNNVTEFANAKGALIKLSEINVDVVFSDLKMPEMDGLEFLKAAKKIKPELKIILITAYASVDSAVSALKEGAYDYIQKPYNFEEILRLINRISELNEVINDNKMLVSQISAPYDFASFIGDSDEIQKIFSSVRSVAITKSTVLITGETGTGKELLTNIIHYNSDRKRKALVKVSCAILSREIFESELFGHEKGAFTGADHMKKGRFEIANGGTLYLDDIDDIPLDLQVKLLRVLQEGEVERVGGTAPINIDVRIIASTKYNLLELVKEGKFREDLYYRLHVFPIHIPPLRNRVKDIKLLVHYFAKQIANTDDIRVDSDVTYLLSNYQFPGNTRELKNLVERMIITSKNDNISIDDVPFEIKNPPALRICSSIGKKPLNEMIADFEISAIKLALDQCGNNKSKAAELLGMPDSTLRTKIEKYSIQD
jgi:DNA-binding NtrC family response regulator